MSGTYADWVKKRKEKEAEDKKASVNASSSTQNTNPSSSTGGKSSGGTYADWVALRKRERYGSTAQDWSQKSTALLGDMQRYYSDWKADDSSKYGDYSQQVDELMLMGKKYREQYADDPDAVASIDEISNALYEMRNAVLKQRGVYRKYDSAEKYTDAVELSKRYGVSDAVLKSKLNDTKNPIAYTTSEGEDITWAQINSNREMEKINSMSVGALAREMKTSASGIAYTTPDGQAVTWKQLYEKKKKEEDETSLYNELSSNSDFKEYALKGASIENPTVKEAEAGANLFGWRPGSKEIGNIVTYSRDNWDEITREANENDYTPQGDIRYTYMSDRQVEIYNYYLAKFGKEKASEYLKSIEDDLTDIKWQKDIELSQKMAKETPFLASVSSVGTSLLSGVEYLYDLGNWAFTGELDTNQMSEMTNAIRGTVSEETNWMIGNWDAFDFVYNTAMSGTESLTAAFIPGGAVVLGLSAAAQATNDALSRGMSNGQAFWNGLIAGTFEGLFEKLSIGNFKSLKEVAPDSIKAVLKNIGKSMLVNASEESLTEIANIAYDTIVNGEFANYTWDELKNGAWKQALAQVIESGASGALMGAGFGVLGSAGGYAKGNAEAKATYGSDSAAIVGDALEIDPNNTFAQRMQGRLDDGKNLSGNQLRKLVESNDTAKIQQAVTERLTELGAKENVPAVAAALTKQAMGKDLSKAEQDLIRRNMYAPRVAQELNPENIRSGEYTSDWAQKIGTRRINAAEYSRLVEAAQIAPETAETTAEAVSPAIAENVQESAQEAETATVADIATVEEGPTVLNTGDTAEDVELDETTPVNSVKNGRMVLRLADGRNVAAESITHTSANVARVYDTAQQIAPDAKTANTIVNGFKDSGLSAEAYSRAVNLFHMYGNKGYDVADLLKSGSTAKLSAEVRNAAYKAGKIAGGREVAAKQAAVNKGKRVPKGPGKGGRVMFTEGKEVVGGIREYLKSSGKKLTDLQEAGVLAMEKMAAALGTDFYVFESYYKGKELMYIDPDTGLEKPAPNGQYSANGKLYVDLNSGRGGKGLMLYTVAHELTHHIAKWSPAKFKILANYVVKEYNKRGQSVDELVAAKIKLYESRGMEIDYDTAFEEVVADSMEGILADGNVLQMVTEIKKQDMSLGEKIVEWFKNLGKELKAIVAQYAGRSPDSAEGKMVLEMQDVIDQIEKLYAEALVDASESFSAAMESVVKPNAEAVAEGTILTDGAVVTDGKGGIYSIRSMKEDIAEGKMFEDLKTYCGWTQTQVDELRNNLNELVEYMIPYRDKLDFNETYGREGRRFSPYKPNSDPLYKISMDFSTLCSKRLLTQFVIENLQLRENRPMTAEEQMAIRDMLNEYRSVEKGLQVACAMCYVEAARLKSPKQIAKWMSDPETQMRNYFADKNPEFAAFIKEKQADFKESRGYARNATKKDMSAKDVRELNKIRPRLRSQYKVSAEEAAIIEKAKSLPNSTYLTAANLANLSETDPTIYSAYTAFVRTATRSKSLETDEPYYYGDSRRDNGNGIVVTDDFIEAVNRENGMRFSSWSDWRIQHMLDYITAVIDNSVRGAAMHGYTKFGEEVRVLGKTGMMFNMSGVAGTQTGLNEDGSLSFSPTESIDVNEAIELRDEFPDTAGLQCIGVSDEHILALLRSDIIDYVIPYHVSGLNAGLRAMANIHGWQDYTNIQHAAIDKNIKFENAVDKEHWHEEPVFSEFFVGYDTDMTGVEAMKASAERYKQMCAERGLKPKFEQFAKEDGYWKLLIDRKMVNQKTGNLIQQKPVTPKFDFGAVKEVVDRYVQNYDSGLEARALNHVVENWDSIPKRIRDLKKQGSTKAKKVKKATDTLANETVAAQPTAQENSGERSKYSIREDMTEEERYKELKNRQLLAVDQADISEHEGRLVGIESLPPKAKSKVEKQIYELAENLGILLKPMTHPEIRFEFQMSKSKDLKESVHNQLRYGGSYGDFAKVLINLERTIPNAMLIEAHTKDRYEGTHRENKRFEGAYVLFGAFQDSEYVYPVKLEIKRETGYVGKLYVVVVMTKIKRTSVSGSEVPDIKSGRSNPVTGSTYSLQQIVSEINPFDRDFLKYLPDKMLSEEQITAKKEALIAEDEKLERIREETRRILDHNYREALNRGNMKTAQKMVDEAAKAAGYDSSKLKHGTTEFGFTKFDPKFSDDGISIFLTDKDEVAESYSGDTNRRRIADRPTTESILEQIRQFHSGIEQADKETISGIIEENRDKLRDALSAVENFAATAYESDTLAEAVQHLNAMIAAEDAWTLKEEYSGFESVIESLAANEDSEVMQLVEYLLDDVEISNVVHELSAFVGKPMLFTAKKQYAEYFTSHGYTKGDDTYFSAADVDPSATNGVYELYTRPGKQFSIDAEGSYWDMISGGLIGSDSEHVTTRDVAAYAKENGYDSVRIENVIDNGAIGGYTGTGTVYIFFDGNDLKSADPVTYDDSGNVIPLSERFNPKNPDVRYSIRGENAQNIDKEALEQAKAMDKQGASMKEIRSKTGWWKQSDGKWRNEFATKDFLKPEAYRSTGLPSAIEDRIAEYAEYRHSLVDIDDDFYTEEDAEYDIAEYTAKLRDEGITSGKLSEFLDAPELYESYPHLKDTRLVIGGVRGDADGAYYPKSNEIRLRKNYGGRSINGREALLHEIQHAIQEFEGFSKGASLEAAGSYDAYRNTGGEIEARDVAERWRYSDEDRREIEPAMFSLRDGESVSNRSLLANAFEGVAQNDIEKDKIQEYKSKIDTLNAEEQKLQRLNAEIKQLSFAQGARDTARLEKLRDEAQKTANRINTYDRQLLRLEASKPLQSVLEREKAKAYKRAEQKGREALEALRTDMREKSKQKQRELTQRYQDSRKEAAEKRAKTEMKRKIRKVIRELDKVLNRGNKKRNVKEDMREFVASAISSAEALFTDNYSDEDMIRNGVGVVLSDSEQDHFNIAQAILAKLEKLSSEDDKTAKELNGQLSYRMSKLKDAFARERIRLNDTAVSDVLGNLAAEYEKLKNSEHEYVKAAYQDTVYNHIKSMQDFIGGAKIKDMSLYQMEILYKAYTMAMTTVRDANKAFVMGKSVDNIVEDLVTELEGRKTPKGKVAAVARNVANMTGWNYEKLYYALDRIGSKTLAELFNNLANAENIVMADVREAKAKQREIVKKYKYNTWNVNEKIKKDFVDNTGKKFRLTLGELMSLYAYSRREGAWNHIEYGGFVFGKSALTDTDPVTAYKLTKEQCEAITNTLKNEQKKFVEEMQTFLSDTMGAKGNEVSMLLYGIEMFGEKNYFPIHIAGQFMARAQESQAKAAAGFSSMTNAGFTQAQNKQAKAPFVMESFMDVWADHVNEMSRYHGSVPALEDIRKVMNYSHYSDSFMDSASVKAIMENKFGKRAVEYFNDLYQEANSGAIRDKLQETSHKWLSKFRKSSVAYSLSVLIQQPASMVRAYAMVPVKYFRGLGVGALPVGVAQATFRTKAYKNAYEEMLKYAPGVTLAKEIGGFDTASGGSIRSYLLDTEKTLRQQWKTETGLKGRADTFMGMVDDNPIANLPNVADKIAWIEIWNACKRETASNNPKMPTKSDAFMEKVGERFTEVIRATQVYDSIFAKSPMLKSKNLAVQYLVSFMNEPNTTANMAESAARAIGRGDIKSGAMKLGSIIGSTIFTCVLKSIIYAMRDDDEDETYVEKYIGSLVNNLISDATVFNYIPVFRDVWSMVQGYDVERPDMAVISDALSSITGLVTLASKKADDMTEEELVEWDKKVIAAHMKLLDSICAVFGIPEKNVRREIKAVLDHARIAAENAGMTTWASIEDSVMAALKDASPTFMYPGIEKKSDKLYQAFISGDTAYYERLQRGYKDEKAVKSALIKALRENDPRVQQAAAARLAGDMDTYKKLFYEIKNEGNFVFDDIMSAIDSEITALEKAAGGDTSGYEAPDWDNDAVSVYDVEDYFNAAVSGDTASATQVKNDLIAELKGEGYLTHEAEDNLASSFTSKVKKAYMDGELGKYDAESLLTLYGGKTDGDEASSEIEKWNFEMEQGYSWGARARGYRLGRVSERDLIDAVMAVEGASYDEAHSYIEFLDLEMANEDINITADDAAGYFEHAEPAGISVNVYLNYKERANACTGQKDEDGKTISGTKKAEIMEVIDSLPISNEQKDALYYANGWKSKTIYEAPWH